MGLVGLLVLPALVGARPAAASEGLGGVWEIKSLGADRRVEIWQQGGEILAYRVMFPEFDGERYKLEHLYRGRLVGNHFEGQLYVREEGMTEFDSLRGFDGRIEGDGKLLLDGLPIERTSEPLRGAPPSMQKKKPKKRSGRAPSMTMVDPRATNEEVA